jgi:hypothetical protein
MPAWSNSRAALKAQAGRLKSNLTDALGGYVVALAEHVAQNGDPERANECLQQIRRELISIIDGFTEVVIG